MRSLYESLSDEQKMAHQEAWRRVEAKVIALAARPTGRKKPAVYEVHHAVEYARRLYFAAMERGFCAFDCEREVNKAYPAE